MRSKSLRIRRSDENSHLVCVGDTGTGKSQLLYQILDQIEARGDVAVVLDTQKDGFLSRNYRPERGDWVLNPTDERVPYWNIFDEVTDEADAVAVSTSVFPPAPFDVNDSSKFFHGHTVGISSHLLAYGATDDCPHPTTADFGYWLAHPSEIDRRVKGTEHEHTLTKNAAPQRAGILGSLNAAGRPLRMMPTAIGNRRQFCVRDWVQKRQGWIFITNNQDTRIALRPLQSMWMDMIILRLLSMGYVAKLPRVWLIMDEMESMQTLPTAHTGITEMRKTGNVMVMAFQNFADLEVSYGRKAATIFSQPMTKFVLRTSHAESARQLQDLIGNVKLRRVRTTHALHLGGHRRRDSETIEEITEPLVMASEIQSLNPLNGYFIQPGHIVKIAIKHIARPVIAPQLIPRPIPPMEKRPEPEPESVASDMATTGSYWPPPQP